MLQLYKTKYITLMPKKKICNALETENRK